MYYNTVNDLIQFTSQIAV